MEPTDQIVDVAPLEAARLAGTLKVAASSRHFTTQLSPTLPAPEMIDGVECFALPVAVLGSWIKGKDHFTISKANLREMVANFDKRKNGQIQVDYEHASENPDVAMGQPVPAAGFIHELRANGVLKALVEFSPRARQMIVAKEYRFVSPAIDWAAKDKETGQPQGCTLTSLALTNHPFLEELPPLPALQFSEHAQSPFTIQIEETMLRAIPHPGAILMTDLTEGEPPMTAEQKTTALALAATILKSGTAEDHKKFMSEAGLKLAEEMSAAKKIDVDLSEQPSDDSDDSEDTLSTAPRLTLKKMTSGSRDGHAGAFSDGHPVGYVTKAHLTSVAKKFAPPPADTDAVAASAAKRAESDLRSQLGIEPTVKLSDAKGLIQTGLRLVGTEARSKAFSKLLADSIAADGTFDSGKATVIISSSAGVLTIEDYNQLHAAERQLSDAVRETQILPHQRRLYFKVAMGAPVTAEEFSEFLKAAPKQVNLTTVGHGGDQPIPVDEEIAQEKKTLRENNPTWSEGRLLTEVRKRNPELSKRYDAAHRSEMGSRPQAN